MLFCGPYSRASANSAEGLALLKTLYGKVCAESTGEACSLLEGQKYYKNFVYNALTACIILLAITISANLHLYITNCLERRKVKRNASRHRRAAMLYSDLQSIHRQHTAPV